MCITVPTWFRLRANIAYTFPRCEQVDQLLEAFPPTINDMVENDVNVAESVLRIWSDSSVRSLFRYPFTLSVLF